MLRMTFGLRATCLTVAPKANGARVRSQCYSALINNSQQHHWTSSTVTTMSQQADDNSDITRSHNRKYLSSSSSSSSTIGSFTRSRSPYNAFGANQQQQRYFSSNYSNFKWKTKQSPYEILGGDINRHSTPKEIKLAYFREAKRYHPDLNPNDPDAKRRFQEISAAYELLSDPKRKAMYDATGYTGDQTGSGGSHNQQYQTQQEYAKHAEDIFNEVTNDFDVVKDALQSYSEELKDEMDYAIDCMRYGDWQGVLEVAKAHKGMIFGIVIPSFLLLRYPPAVFAALRLAWGGSQLIVAGLVYTGNLQVAARYVWRKIVALSNEQRERAKNRGRRQN